MLIIHYNVISVDVQLVSYIFIYLSIGICSKLFNLSVGIFSKLFNRVFVSNCLLDVLFSFHVNDT